jgi:nucleotide-binding universal stress UspA family protein
MEEHVIGSHGRLFDVVVVGREFGQPWLNWRKMLESALFDSGRPVLLTPSTLNATFGENVIIAWHSSTETVRAVASSMALLTRARNVTVLSVEGWGVPDPEAKEVAQYLARAGVPATARTVDPDGRSPAETVLAECSRSGADLLIKGAYTQSRLRQLMFGGATRHIIAHAQIPVVLAN